MGSAATWNVGRIPKEKTPTLSGDVEVNLGGGEGGGGDGSGGGGAGGGAAHPSELCLSALAEFHVAGLPLSGLRVRELRVSHVEYKPYKGVRYVARAGDFYVRF